MVLRYAVRYFSPLAEVPFCGHATIATGVLAEREGPDDFDYDFAALKSLMTDHGWVTCAPSARCQRPAG